MIVSKYAVRPYCGMWTVEGPGFRKLVRLKVLALWLARRLALRVRKNGGQSVVVIFSKKGIFQDEWKYGFQKET